MPTPALESAFATAVEAAAAVGRAHEEAGLIGSGGASPSPSPSSELLPASVEEWVSAALRPGMARAVHAWASGARFVDVCGLTEAMEGTIVRTVMRVDEVRSDGGGGDGEEEEEEKNERERKKKREREREEKNARTKKKRASPLFLPLKKIQNAPQT